MRRILTIAILTLSLLGIVSPALADGGYRRDYTGLGDQIMGWTPVPGQPVTYYTGDKLTVTTKPYATWAQPASGAPIKFEAPQFKITR